MTLNERYTQNNLSLKIKKKFSCSRYCSQRFLTKEKSWSSLKKVSTNIFDNVIEHLKTEQLPSVYLSNEKKLKNSIIKRFDTSEWQSSHVMRWCPKPSDPYEHLKAIITSDLFANSVRCMVVNYTSLRKRVDRHNFVQFAQNCKNLETLEFHNKSVINERLGFYATVNEISSECTKLNEIVLKCHDVDYYVKINENYYVKEIKKIFEGCLQVSKITVTDIFDMSYFRIFERCNMDLQS